MDKNGLQDIGILRQAALELQADSQDLVVVASILQRIKNWWKAKFSPEFAKKQDQIKSSYESLKDPMGELLQSLKRLDDAFKSQDPDVVAQLAGELPEVITKVTRHLSNLSKDLHSADKLIPTSLVEKPIAKLYKDFQKDLTVLEKLKSQLPKDLDVPISTNIKQPITNFKWFSRFSKSDIYVSDTVKETIKRTILKQLTSTINGLDKVVAEDIVNAGIDEFVNIIKLNLLTSNTILNSYSFPSVKNEREIEMVADVNMGVINFPAPLNIRVDLPHLLFHDLATRYGVQAINKLTIFKPANMTVEVGKAEKKEPAKANEPAKDDNYPESVLAFDGTLSNIVKNAIIRETLPKTRILITTSGNSNYLLKFAKILVSALREELNADSSSVHLNNNVVEVETDIYGSKTASDLAVKEITYNVADQFIKEFKHNIGIIDFEVNASSKLKLVSSNDFDNAFRKIDLDAIMENNET